MMGSSFVGVVDPIVVSDVVDRATITSSKLLAVCGGLDNNALLAAVLGLLFSLSYLFFVRRWRDGLSVARRAFADKFFLVTISLLFVVVIVRLMRAG